MSRPPESRRAATRARARLVTVTGATGFIERRLVVALAAAGWHTRLLMRREPDEARWRDLRSQVVVGSLGDTATLERLVDGADAVIHVAGAIKAAQRSEFFRVNRDAAARLAETARRSHQRRISCWFPASPPATHSCPTTPPANARARTQRSPYSASG